MQNIPPQHFLEFIEREYLTIRQWVHEDEAYVNDDKNYPLSNSPIKVSYPDGDVKISDEYRYLFFRYFGSVSAWVRKNDELRQTCDTGSRYHRPRLMQVSFLDFLALEGWL
jgi:hypothetical protein